MWHLVFILRRLLLYPICSSWLRCNLSSTSTMFFKLNITETLNNLTDICDVICYNTTGLFTSLNMSTTNLWTCNGIVVHNIILYPLFSLFLTLWVDREEENDTKYSTLNWYIEHHWLHVEILGNGTKTKRIFSYFLWCHHTVVVE